MNITLVCEESFDGIMCAIYKAWELMLEGNEVHIFPGQDYEYNMFTEYRQLETDIERAIKVAESIRVKISLDAYIMVFRACSHFDKNRADAVFEFLKIGYKVGGNVTKRLGDPIVMQVMEYSRKVMNEVHMFKEFVRFSELNNNILFSKIEPRCDVLPLINQHFSNRYPLENWIIYDENRKKAMIHKCKSESIIIGGEEVENKMQMIENKDKYEELWSIFFKTIAIESRINPKCQRTHLPEWYRKNMTEFN